MAKRRFPRKKAEVVDPSIEKRIEMENKDSIYLTVIQSVNLREMPSKTSKILKILLPGTRVVSIEEIEKDNGWFHIHLFDNPEIEGYVVKRFLEEGIA